MPYTVNGVSMDGIPADTVYKVDSSIERVDDLKTAVASAFAKDGSVDLVTYNVSITPADAASSMYRPNDSNGVMLTAVQADAAAQDEETTDGEAEASCGGDDAAAGDSTTDDAAVGAPNVPSDMGPLVSSAVIELGIDGGWGRGHQCNHLEGSDARGRFRSRGPFDRTSHQPDAVRRGCRRVAGGIVARVFSNGKSTCRWQPPTLTRSWKRSKSKMDADPVWISSSSVGARVAGDMIGRAFGALFASLLCIIGYIWFRFQRVLYGFAAVAALVHDVLITLSAIAVSYWLADYFGFLLIDPFKISLTVVAAILTIIGYSLNDTIVVFDRIRETKGKAPRLTGEMINTSINQTLSRTLLTSLTTLIVVCLLYCFGGEGIHAFAFALVIGVIVGTYSSIFIASPILLWLIERKDQPKAA